MPWQANEVRERAACVMVIGWPYVQECSEIVEMYDASANKWTAFFVEPTDDETGRRRAFTASCKLELST